MDNELVTLRTESLSAAFSAFGAEPHSLIDQHGTELLWQAGDAWKRHAPILFPAICRVGADDHLRVGGRSYPMTQHGFARDLMFSVVDTDERSAAFVLVSDDATRERFPFEFALAVRYEVDGASLGTTYTVQNRGDVVMPFSLGSHPAFVWQPEREDAGAARRIEFERPEPAPFRRVDDNLLTGEEFDSIAATGAMQIEPALFDDGAVIWTDVVSSSLRFGSAGGRVIEMSWDGFTGITLWTKPGAEFLCVEPWRGEPAPVGYLGAWADKPGNVLLDPGGRATFSYRLTLL